MRSKHSTSQRHGASEKREELLRYINGSGKKKSKSSGKRRSDDKYNIEFSDEELHPFDIGDLRYQKSYLSFVEEPSQENRALFNIFKWLQHTLPGFTKNVPVGKEESKCGRPNESGEPQGALPVAHPEGSEVSVFSAPLPEIPSDNIRNMRHVLVDSETDMEQPLRQKPGRRSSSSRQFRRSTTKSKFVAPNCDLESVISYEADLSTDDSSLEPSLKPDTENFKMKMMTTGEIKEIDDMLVGSAWNRRVYGRHPLKARVQKGVIFKAVEEIRQESGPLSAVAKESTRSLEQELGKNLHKAEHVMRKGKPLTKKEFHIK